MTSNDSGADADAFVYMGEPGPAVPKDVVRVRIDPSVVAIPAEAFRGRNKMEEVELHDGLQKIGRNAFLYCTGLRQIRIPSAVEIISDGAFRRCHSLARVDLCEGLRVILPFAFLNCPFRHIIIPSSVKRICAGAFYHVPRLSSLTLPDGLEHLGGWAFSRLELIHFRVPPLITSIEKEVFRECSSMFSVELPEAIIEIGRGAFDVCTSLRNVAIPPNANVGGHNFSSCTSLKELFESESEITEALKGRFDGLPIHRVIYYQSYQPVASTLDQFDRASNMGSGHHRALQRELNPTGNQQDCLGMTPLHILACSTNQNIDLYRLVIEKYPENLVTRDRWGSLPLLYLLWRNDINENMKRSPLWDIITLLIESYRSTLPHFGLDWSEMIKALALGNATKKIIQNFVVTQRRFFPDQSIDWVTVLDQLAQDDIHSNWRTFCDVVGCSIEERLRNISVKQLRENFEFEFNDIASNFTPDRRGSLVEIQSKLTYYEVECDKLKEATALLELALWRAKITESEASTGFLGGNCKQKTKIGASGFRSECHIRCGANHVVKNVIPFLLPESVDKQHN